MTQAGKPPKETRTGTPYRIRRRRICAWETYPLSCTTHELRRPLAHIFGNEPAPGLLHFGSIAALRRARRGQRHAKREKTKLVMARRGRNRVRATQATRASARELKRPPAS